MRILIADDGVSLLESAALPTRHDHKVAAVAEGKQAWAPGGDNASKLISQADSALRSSRKLGRNRVTHHRDMNARKQ